MLSISVEKSGKKVKIWFHGFFYCVIKFEINPVFVSPRIFHFLIVSDRRENFSQSESAIGFFRQPKKRTRYPAGNAYARTPVGLLLGHTHWHSFCLCAASSSATRPAGQTGGHTHSSSAQVRTDGHALFLAHKSCPHAHSSSCARACTRPQPVALLFPARTPIFPLAQGRTRGHTYSSFLRWPLFLRAHSFFFLRKGGKAGTPQCLGHSSCGHASTGSDLFWPFCFHSILNRGPENLKNFKASEFLAP